MKMSEKDLLEQLQSQDAAERLVAVKKLGMHYDPGNIPKLLPLLKDTSAEVREATIISLGVLGTEEILNPILEKLKDSNKDVKLAAIKVLGDFGSTKATKPLIKLLNDKDAQIRQAAVVALGAISDKNALFPLIDALEDSDSSVIFNAILALGQIGDSRAIEPILEIIENAQDSIQQVAAITLGRLGDPKSIPSLKKLLKSNNEVTRRYAVIALGKIGDPQIIEPLIPLLSDEDSYVRQATATVLSEIKDSKTTFHFIQKLHDEDPEIRATAAKALGKLGDPISIKNLIQLCNDPDADVREEVVYALGELHAEDATKALIKLTKDKNPEVRVAVAKAVGQIEGAREIEDSLGGKLSTLARNQALRPLNSLLKDPEIKVRAQAADSLAKIAFNQFNFKKAKKYFEIASKESLSWDFHQGFYEATALGCEILMNFDDQNYNIPKEQFETIYNLLESSAAMIGKKTFLSYYYWKFVETLDRLFTTNDKNTFVNIFKELGVKLVDLEQNTPKSLIKIFEEPQKAINTTFQIINKRGLPIDESKEELEQVKPAIFSLGKHIFYYAPIEISEKTQQDDISSKHHVNSNQYLNFPQMVMSSQITRDNIASSPAAIASIEKTLKLSNNKVSDAGFTTPRSKKYKIHEIAVNVNVEEIPEILIAGIQLMKGAKPISTYESALERWLRNVERYYDVKLFEENGIYKFTKSAVNFRLKPKIIGFMDDVIYEGSQLVIFPETSIPQDYIPKLQEFASRNSLFILVGAETILEQNAYINRAYLLTPNKGKKYTIQKNIPTHIPGTGEKPEGWTEKIQEQSTPIFNLFHTPLGAWLIVFGNDFWKFKQWFPHITEEYDPDLLIIINNGIEDYDEFAENKELINEMQCPIMYVNSGQYGGTGVYFPEHLNNEFAKTIATGYAEGVLFWNFNRESKTGKAETMELNKIEERSQDLANDSLQRLVEKIKKKKD